MRLGVPPRVLASHQGFDPGALAAARTLSRRLEAPLITGTVTRLLVDLNRSEANPRLWSRYSRRLDSTERGRVLEEYYVPYRRRVEAHIEALVARRTPVVHVAVHSFTPRRRGRTRRGDVGLLYDPDRRRERDCCARWLALFSEVAPDLRVRRNDPYRGRSDGLTTALRRRFPSASYLGIELELNQRWIAHAGAERRRLIEAAATSLRRLLDPRDRSTAAGERRRDRLG